MWGGGEQVDWFKHFNHLKHQLLEPNEQVCSRFLLDRLTLSFLGG